MEENREQQEEGEGKTVRELTMRAKNDDRNI